MFHFADGKEGKQKNFIKTAKKKTNKICVFFRILDFVCFYPF